MYYNRAVYYHIIEQKKLKQNQLAAVCVLNSLCSSEYHVVNYTANIIYYEIVKKGGIGEAQPGLSTGASSCNC